jgi:hypothetical protein
VDFPLSVYLFVNGWNRTTSPGQRCRIVCASNPPSTAEGEWVIERWGPWLDPTAGKTARPGELRWYTTLEGESKEQEFPDSAPVTFKGKTYQPRSRTFIPGEMLDVLVATGYHSTLATLPEPLRSIYLLGDFSSTRLDDRWQLIPTRWVLEAQKRWGERMAQGSLPSLSRLGVDVAMSAADAGDWTVLAPLHGLTIGTLVKRPSRETPDGQSVVALVLAAGGGSDSVRTHIDAIGIGKSALDVARATGLKNVQPVIVSESAYWRDPRTPQLTFTNVRAAMMWNVRSLLDPEGGPPETRLALPPDRELLVDLTAPRYELRTSGIAVESKEHIRDRIGRSTDAGDAVALACWPGRTPARASINGERF